MSGELFGCPRCRTVKSARPVAAVHRDAALECHHCGAFFGILQALTCDACGSPDVVHTSSRGSWCPAHNPTVPHGRHPGMPWSLRDRPSGKVLREMMGDDEVREVRGRA